MDVLNYLYSCICGQNHCYIFRGTELPLCQRCQGLYTGAVLTFCWLLITKIWRKGLPALDILIVHIILLITAMLSGLHLVRNPGNFTFLCGLFTGQVMTIWLIGASVEMSVRLNLLNHKTLWHRSDKIIALAPIFLFIILALFINHLQFIPPAGWLFLACCGTIVLITGSILAVSIAIYYKIKL